MTEIGNEIPTRYKLPSINEFCHFISYPNMRAIDALYYLLSYGVGKNGTNPPAYLIHNLINDKGYITTFDEIMSPTSIEFQPNIATIPRSFSESDIADDGMHPKDIATNSDDGGIHNAELFFNYRFMEYDQETRTWEDYSINKMTLNNLLTKQIDETQEKSIYLDVLNEDVSQSKFYKFIPHSHPVLYDIMRNLEVYSSELQFTLKGNFELDVGQVIYIKERGKNNSRISQFYGRWVICKIRHSLKDKQFYTNIVCCRRFEYKNISLF